MDNETEAERLARTYVWWQDPRATLSSPRKLLCQILRFGRAEAFDATRLRRVVNWGSPRAVARALSRARSLLAERNWNDASLLAS